MFSVAQNTSFLALMPITYIILSSFLICYSHNQAHVKDILASYINGSCFNEKQLSLFVLFVMDFSQLKHVLSFLSCV